MGTKCRHGKAFRKKIVCLAMTLLWVYSLTAGPALAAPTGGVVTSGTAAIVQSGNTTNINQSTNKASINWQTFSIKPAETVNFNQPSVYAITLNRVVGNESSLIQGALNATGRVFLLNSNGVLFTKGSSVNTSGFLASTLNLTDANFNAGNYVFNANGSLGSVVNQGTITANNGGYVALLGNTVSNQGVIAATKGTVVLASGDMITLNFNGNSLLNVTIDQGTLNALVENKQAIYADGGTVILTAKAADDLLSAQVNNSGLIQARTIDDLKGDIKLLAQGGTVNVAGTLDASAPNGGDGGLIETSGNSVKVADSAIVTTYAARGKTGTWLIDPDGYTIAASGGDITGATLGSQLASNNVTIASTSGHGSDGNLNVNDVVTWAANTTLGLNATNNINVNAPITGSGVTSGLTLNAGADINVNAPSSLQVAGLNATAANNVNINAPQTWANNGAWTFSGTNINVNDTVNWSNGTLTFNAGASGGFINLNAVMTAGANANLAMTYNTGMDTSTTTDTGVTMPSSTYGTPFGGINPLVDPTTGLFIGRIDVSNTTAGALKINGNAYTLITSMSQLDALDGYNAVTRTGTATAVTGNYGLAMNLDAGGTTYTTALIQTFTGNLEGLGHTISNLTIIPTTTSNYIGLIGTAGTTSANNVSGTVVRDIGIVNVLINDGGAQTRFVGGLGVGALMGTNDGTVINAFATGNNAIPVTVLSTIYPTGAALPQVAISGKSAVGGLVGTGSGVIVNSHASVDVYATQIVGGLTGGINASAIFPNAVVTNCYATGAVYAGITSVNGSVVGLYGVGGLVGKSIGGVISNSYATGNVTTLNVSEIGDLLGLNTVNSAVNLIGAVYNSSSSGSVTINWTGLANNGQDAGGLVGRNDGLIVNGASTSNVSVLSNVPGFGNAYFDYVGPLVGENYNFMSYAGNYKNSNASGTITESYINASGATITNPPDNEGLAGWNSSGATNTGTYTPGVPPSSTAQTTSQAAALGLIQTAATARSQAQTLAQQANDQQAAAQAFAAQQQANFESNGQQTGGQASFSGQGSNTTGQGLNNQIGSFTPSNTGTVNGTMDNHIVYSDSGSYSATIKSITADGVQFDLEGGSQGGGNK